MFTLCLSFTLSPFECKNENVPDFEGEYNDFSILKEEQIWVPDKAMSIPSFLILIKFDCKLILEVFDSLIQMFMALGLSWVTCFRET